MRKALPSLSRAGLLLGLLAAVPTAPYGVAVGEQSPAGAEGGGIPFGDEFLRGLTLSGNGEPIHIRAAALDVDYRSDVIMYRGAVVVTQGDVRLESDTVRVTYAPQDRGGLKEVVAEGNVKITRGDHWATGGRAVFDRVAGTVTLTENAVLHKGANRVSGERITVYLDEDRGVVEGGRNGVTAVLYPEKRADE